MTLRRLTAALALVLLSCDPLTANGTTFFAAVAWQDGWPIFALRFSGDASGQPVFNTQTRPDPPAALLHPTQSVRILLSDAFDGELVNLTVEGLQDDGGVNARGSAMATVTKDREVNVAVELSQGGIDGGTLCECPTGCCKAGEKGCATNGGVFFCPRTAGSVCSGIQCSVLSANRCGNGCTCGMGGACGPGLRCEGTGMNATCACDPTSACSGCCANNTTCIQAGGEDISNCGNGGSACDNCNARCLDAGVCDLLMSCGGGMCHTGKSCQPAQWPRCERLGLCVACDPLRSDQCSSSGISVEPCQCGATGAACDAGTFCVADGGQARCVPIFN
jgi:hypothetical protein